MVISAIEVSRAIDTMAPSDALPVGATRIISEMQPVLVNPAYPGSGLVNAVLALLSPQSPDENERYDEEILDLTVVGFLIMCGHLLGDCNFSSMLTLARFSTNIDTVKKKFTILAPNRGSFIGRTAIAGSYEFREQ